MPRLFITPREIDFISDITKEIVKDVRKKSTVELSLTNLDHGLSVEQDGAQVKTLSSGHTT